MNSWAQTMQTHFPNQWEEMSLTLYLVVCITITHSFLSRLHGHASSPGAVKRRRPTCIIPGEVNLLWEMHCLTALLTLYSSAWGELMINCTKTTRHMRCKWQKHYAKTLHRTDWVRHLHKYTQSPQQTVCKVCWCLFSVFTMPVGCTWSPKDLVNENMNKRSTLV